MALSTTISALHSSLRFPRKAVSLLVAGAALTAIAIAAASSGRRGASAGPGGGAQGSLRLTSRVWLSSTRPGQGYRLHLVSVHPNDRDELGYDASIVLYRLGHFGERERFRGSFDWNDRTGRELAVHLLTPSEKRFIAHARVERCSEGAFDACLEITGLPEGPTRFYSNGSMTRPPERAPKYP